MAENREDCFVHFSPCTPKRGDDRKGGKARWKDRCEKKFGSVFSAEYFKKLFHLKPSSLNKASASKGNSLKKPPFFVPGRIVYNDSHLLQSVPQVKNPSAKKTVTRTGVVKVASSQFGASRKPLGKIKSATNMEESSKPITDACPHCKAFIPSTVAQEVDDLHASSAFSQNSAPNPFITIDRRTSSEKPFSSLLKSPESSTIPVSYSPEEGQAVDNSEDSDCESKEQEKHHEIVALAEACLRASSAKPISQNSAPNPFIAIDRRTSSEKPFSSLLKSPESSTIPVSYSPEEGQAVDNSEDSDCESKEQDKHHEIVALAEACLRASFAKPISQNSAPNPFITIDRRTSSEKPFSSLLKSPEFSTSPVSYSPGDGQDVDNSEDSDCESKEQEKHHGIVALVEAHQNKSEFEFSESCVQITEPPRKTDFEASLHAENSKGKAQQVQEQEVCQNNDDGGINKSESEVEKSAIQIACPSDDEAEEDVHYHNLHAENIEIAQQLRAHIEEKKKLLDELCRKWNSRLKEESIPNEEIGAVLTVIGQTQLLQRERIHQYACLILKFENNNSDEKKILKSDLEGFWEMILLQVTDVENKFIELESLLGNGWIRQENVEFQLKKKQKRKPKKENVDKVYVNSSRIKFHIASLRKKKMESNSLISTDCVSYADQVSLSNPGEVAFTLPVIDKRSPFIQPEISTPSSLISADCVSHADKVSLSNPGEVAFTLPVTDKRSPFIQPEISTPRQMNETLVTPNYIKVLRRKHKSGSTITFFSSPHQTETDSPRMRSRSTNCMLDKPPVPISSIKKIVPSNQLLEIPKIFSPTVKQLITRSGRISRSPERFGHTEEQRNSSYADISSGLSPTVKLFATRTGRVCRSPNRFGQTEEYVERNSVTSEHIGITTNKEENNNDMKDSFSAVNLPNCTRKI